MQIEANPGLRDIEIILNHNGHGRLVIDGVDHANSVSGVHFDAVADKKITVTLDLCIRNVVHTRIPGEVVVDEDTAALLIQLGWTPPTGDDDGNGSVGVPPGERVKG